MALRLVRTTTMLALALLEGRFCPGDTVYVDVAGDELVFSEVEEPLAVPA